MYLKLPTTSLRFLKHKQEYHKRCFNVTIKSTQWKKKKILIIRHFYQNHFTASMPSEIHPALILRLQLHSWKSGHK